MVRRRIAHSITDVRFCDDASTPPPNRSGDGRIFDVNDRVVIDVTLQVLGSNGELMALTGSAASSTSREGRVSSDVCFRDCPVA